MAQQLLRRAPLRQVDAWCGLALARLLAAFVALALLSACAIRLAPAYDAELLDGITAANKSTLVLFAKVEKGSPAAEFPQHADEYADAIAGFDALRLRAAARPVPPLAQRLAKLKFVREVCKASDPRECLNSTERALGQIVEGLRRMRDRHRQQGLSEEAVQLLRTPYETEIDQALTVETALKR